jgi:5,10-methylenetetrahydromethanopterin reductase
LGVNNVNFGKVSVNLNGDLNDEELVEKAKKVEKAGVKIVWIGDFDFDPFRTAEIIAENTDLLIGFGVLSASKRDCGEIIEKVGELEERFGKRFVVGIGAGQFRDAKDAIHRVLNCLKMLKPRMVFAGCSSPKITRMASEIADGILINYVDPKLVEELASLTKGIKVSYGPCLILPSEFEEDLVLASAIVLKGVEKRFGIRIEENLEKLVEMRRKGISIKNSEIFKLKDFLLEKFAIAGDVDLVVLKIRKLLAICDHVVLSDPFFRDEKSLKMFSYLLRACEKF